jgi:hypothetical protein
VYFFRICVLPRRPFSAKTTEGNSKNILIMTNFKVTYPTGYQIKDPSNDNIDVNIILSNNSVYFGTLFTIINIEKIMKETNDVSFWATDMLIVKDLKKETINNSIKKIIENGYVEIIFSKIGLVETVYSNKKSFEDIN